MKLHLLRYSQAQEPAKSIGTKVRNIWFLSPLVLSKREKNIQTETTQFVSVCIFFEHRAIYVYFYKILSFVQMALSSKNIQTKLSQFVYFSLVLREREEIKTKYSAFKAPVDATLFLSTHSRSFDLPGYLWMHMLWQFFYR